MDRASKAVIKKDRVICNDLELYNLGWYGEKKGSKLFLDWIEAAALLERGKIELVKDKNKISFSDFFKLCAKDTGFVKRFVVYKDLRERGLPVRLDKDSDFKVYERGSKPSKPKNVKWIVFVHTEDGPVNFDELGKTAVLKDSLWAVVDNDSDVTYYIVVGAKL